MVVVGALQQTTEERLDGDDLEVLPAYVVSRDWPRNPVGLQAKIAWTKGGNRGKHRIVITHVAHLGIGKDRIGRFCARQRHQPVWMRHIQRTQDQGL